MWEFLLRERGELVADSGPFRLGGLLEVELPVRPPERAWMVAPADLVDDDPDAVDVKPGDEPTLFDEPEDQQ
jgi:hypothetical protein